MAKACLLGLTVPRIRVHDGRAKTWWQQQEDAGSHLKAQREWTQDGMSL